MIILELIIVVYIVADFNALIVSNWRIQQGGEFKCSANL